VDSPQHQDLALAGTPQISPWSTARIARILKNYEQLPSPQTIGEARLARQCLSRFWLSAPVDQLETLYGTGIGRCYRIMLGTQLARHRLLREEYAWRDELSRQLVDLFDHPERNNVLLALMPYYRLGQFRINDSTRAVPRWLLEDYASLFEPELLPRLRVRKALPPAGSRPRGPGAGASRGSSQAMVRAPRLAQLTVQAAAELADNDDFLSRAKGLVNLFQIDPSDPEIRKELAGLRLQVGQIWLHTPQQSLERVFRSPFGELYRSLLRSGFGGEELSPAEVALRDQLASCVVDMNRAGAVQALLAALLFYAPGKIRFRGETSRRFIPGWLLSMIDEAAESSTRAAPPAGSKKAGDGDSQEAG
jgi:hypothetical protein